MFTVGETTYATAADASAAALVGACSARRQ
jgi:hypothetical protein